MPTNVGKVAILKKLKNVTGGIMSVSVRINDTFYQEAKSQAQAELRSIPNQIEYWARIGKTALDNPDLSIEAIKEIIIAKHQASEPFEFRQDD